MAAVAPPPAAGTASMTYLAGPLQVLYVLVLIAAALSWLVFSYGYIEDDAFIHLVFARSLFEGRGFAFNDLVTNGDSAPIWPLLLAGLHSAGLDWIACAKLACAAGFVVAVTGALCLTRDLAAGRPEQRMLPVAAVLVIVVNPFFAHWSFSGMEAISAMGLSFWVLWLTFYGSASARRCLVAALLLGVAPLFRPELLLLAMLVGPALLLRRWQALAAPTLGRRFLALAVLVVLMALPLALWAGYSLDTFGSIIPNTNLAKRGGSIRELAPDMLSVYATGFPVTLLLFPLLTLPRLTHWRAPAAVSVLLLWPLACIVFYLADHTVPQTRYCLLSMPAMTIAVLWLIGDLRRPGVFAGAVGAMVLASVVTIGWIVVPHVSNKVRNCRALSGVAAYLRERIPSTSPVAVFQIGQIAFESRHPLVDLGGITSRGDIPRSGDFAARLEWMKAHGARYYISTEPLAAGAAPVFTTTVPFIGWTPDRSLYAIQHVLGIYRVP